MQKCFEYFTFLCMSHPMLPFRYAQLQTFHVHELGLHNMHFQLSGNGTEDYFWFQTWVARSNIVQNWHSSDVCSPLAITLAPNAVISQAGQLCV
jgi:hypothetical protein